MAAKEGIKMRTLSLVIATTMLLGGCAKPLSPPNPQDLFMARLNTLCGKAFTGRITGSEPAGTDNGMTGKPLVMHVRRCTKDRIEIPFNVGEDRSRTWVITRTGSGLRLKHDHRHEDGSSDAVTLYGGDTAAPGTATRQSFPVDAESIANFRANGLDRSVTNIWSVDVDNARFTYELRRPAGPTARLFRVEFDLNQTVETPPTSWGW
jgi:hypothetical protein